MSFGFNSALSGSYNKNRAGLVSKLWLSGRKNHTHYLGKVRFSPDLNFKILIWNLIQRTMCNVAGNSLNNMLEIILSIPISLIHSSFINTYLLSIYYVSGTILDTSEQVQVPVLTGGSSWGEWGNAPGHRVSVALSQGPAGTTKGAHRTGISGAQGWYVASAGALWTQQRIQMPESWMDYIPFQDFVKILWLCSLSYERKMP